MNKDQIRAIIIEWLGGAYDPERRYCGNPDYRQPEDVEELVEKIASAHPMTDA